MKKLILNLTVLAPLALVVWAGTARAGVEVGQITGYVSDPSGLPVSDVKLELTGENMIGGARKSNTNEDGEFRFRNLPPGKYELVATHDLYRSVKTENISVHIGATATVDLVLEPPVAQQAEAYIVKGSVPVVDTERAALGSAISDTFTETVPTSRDYQGITNLLPGVVDPTGSGNPNIHGAADFGNAYMLDGINITDPVTATFSTNFNFDAIKDVEVLTGGRDAEYGNAMGGIVNIVTKSGGNDFHADASMYYRSGSMYWRDKGEEELNRQTYDVNLNVGGPIIRDKLWYFFSGEVPWNIWQLSTTAQTKNIFPDQKGKTHPPWEFRAFYGLGKLTWQPLAWQGFKVMLQGDPTTIFNEQQSVFVHPDAERQRYQGGVIASLISDTSITPELFLNAKISIQHSRLYLFPQSNDFDTAGRSNAETGTYTVNERVWQDDNRYRIQFQPSLTYTLSNLVGEHTLKAGVDVSLAADKWYVAYTGGGYYTDDGLDPTKPDSASGVGLPYRYTKMTAPLDTLVVGDIEGYYIQDIWKPLRTLTIRPGVRVDSARMRNYEGKTVVDINTAAPRIGVVWDPFDDNRTRLRAGYYQYVDTGNLFLSSTFMGKDLGTKTYQYNPITEQYDLFVGESGGPSDATVKSYLQDPFNQQRPRAHEFVVGATREMTPGLALGADFIYRMYQNMFEDDESNYIWNPEGTDVIGYNNGEAVAVYSLGAPDKSFIRYYGLELTLTKRFQDNWEVMASYTFSWTEGTFPGYSTFQQTEAFDNPRQDQYQFGFLPYDIRHFVKIDGSYRLPYGFSLGGSFHWRTGEPYSRLYYNTHGQYYVDYRAPRGYDRTPDGELVELRYPNQLDLDMRLVWQLKELTGQNLDLIGEVYNMLNLRTVNYIEERNLPATSDIQFGDALSKRDPLHVQVGIRYRY